MYSSCCTHSGLLRFVHAMDAGVAAVPWVIGWRVQAASVGIFDALILEISFAPAEGDPLKMPLTDNNLDSPVVLSSNTGFPQPIRSRHHAPARSHVCTFSADTVHHAPSCTLQERGSVVPKLHQNGSKQTLQHRVV